MITVLLLLLLLLGWRKVLFQGRLLHGIYSLLSQEFRPKVEQLRPKGIHFEGL